MILRLSWLDHDAVGQLGELMNAGREEPVGLVKKLIARLDRDLYGVIAAARRRAESRASASAPTSSRCCSPRATRTASR